MSIIDNLAKVMGQGFTTQQKLDIYEGGVTPEQKLDFYESNLTEKEQAELYIRNDYTGCREAVRKYYKQKIELNFTNEADNGVDSLDSGWSLYAELKETLDALKEVYASLVSSPQTEAVVQVTE